MSYDLARFDRRIVPGYAPDGAPVLSLVAKASLVLTPGQPLLHQAHDPALLTDNDTDVESDLVAWKPMADVVVVGRAHAPRGKQARFFDVGVAVDGRVMGLRVFGRRTVDLSGGSLRFTEPEAFASMPLGCELAYGGVDSLSDPGTVHVYPPNPFGKGYRVFAHPESLHGLELPCLEDPSQILTPENFLAGAADHWTRQPQPRHLGCTSRASFPRCDLAGLPPDAAMDAKLAHQKQMAASPSVGADGASAPPPPKRMDPRFYNGAPEPLQFARLEGTERIRLIYMDPDFPLLEFELPGIRPDAWLDVGQGPQTMGMVLQNVEIRPDQRMVHLVWRGSCAWAGLSSGLEFTCFEHDLILG